MIISIEAKKKNPAFYKNPTLLSINVLKQQELVGTFLITTKVVYIHLRTA